MSIISYTCQTLCQKAQEGQLKLQGNAFQMSNEATRINLGCGNQRLPGYIGLDRLRHKGVDIICDLEYPLPLAPESIDEVYAKSLLEHIENLELLLIQILRVLKPGGIVYFYVPRWSNPFYYSDYTHRRFFGLTSFDYFAYPDEQLFRHVPTYTTIYFRTMQVRLLFKSPFGLINGLLKGFQWLINRKSIWQLFYEYHLSTFIPCYAIEYILRKEK